MSYMQVNELKKSRELRRRLEEDGEIVITRDGRPCAIMVGIEPEELETSLAEIRRALFSAAVGRVRERAAADPPSRKTIRSAVANSRKHGG